MSDDGRRAHLRAQLETYRGNLRHLLAQVAMRGGEGEATLEQHNSLRSQRAAVARIKGELLAEGVALADAPEDGAEGAPAVAAAPGVAPPPRLLLLFAAPLVRWGDDDEQPLAALDGRAELGAILGVCSGFALDARLGVASASRLSGVFGSVLQPFDLLHLSAHAVADGDEALLLLEDDEEPGLAHPVAAAGWAALLGDRPCRLALLSACHSARLASVLIERGVEHLVAIDGDTAVLDLAARIFCAAFYPALLAGRSVADAFGRGVQAVQSSDALRRTLDPHSLLPASSSEPPKFLLLPADDPAHERPLLPQQRPGAPTGAPLPAEATNLPPADGAPFVGRRRQLFEVMQALADPQRRCVAIQGFGGMGKTALATAAAR